MRRMQRVLALAGLLSVLSSCTPGGSAKPAGAATPPAPTPKWPLGEWYDHSTGREELILVLDEGDTRLRGNYRGLDVIWRLGSRSVICAEVEEDSKRADAEVMPGLKGQDGGKVLLFVYDEYRDEMTQILPKGWKGHVTTRLLERRRSAK